MRAILIIVFSAIIGFGSLDITHSNTIRPGRPQPRHSQAQEPAQPEQKPAPADQAGQQENEPQQAGGQKQPGQQSQPQQAEGEEQPDQQSQPQEAEGEAYPDQADRSGQAQAGEQPQPAAQDDSKQGPDSSQQESQAAGEETKQDASESAQAQEAEAREEPQQAAKEENLSLDSLGNLRSDLSGQPLVLPESSDNMDFLNGEWVFDRELKGTGGDTVNWEFSARDGVGVAVLRDKNNNAYEARMSARLEDGVLRMRTDKFTSKTSPKSYNSEYIECRNGPKGAVCTGSDGFGEWSGEQIFRAPGSVAKGMQTPAGSGSESSAMVELAADGPEMPAEVLAGSTKATMVRGDEAVGSLAGHWRYSQELARKADGTPVTMEFHFDANGKGYSLIKGGNEGDFRAEATAAKMPNGALRVKTEAYSNGKGKSYYPTFMECQAKAGQPLACNLSNGWMHSENGRLVDLNSYQENMQRTQIEELMPGTSESPAAQSESQNMEDILAGAAEAAQKSYNESTSQGKTRQESARTASLQLPQKGDSVSFMEGNWICHTGLASTKTGEPVVMEFSFNKNGKGTGTILERKSGQRYTASAQASFRNGVLRVNTSQFRGRRGGYNSNSIECRNQGGAAQCRGKNGNVIWNANFVRR